MKTERIVCAAIRRGNRIALGARHYDDFMIALLGIPKAGDEQRLSQSNQQGRELHHSHSLLIERKHTGLQEKLDSYSRGLMSEMKGGFAVRIFTDKRMR